MISQFKHSFFQVFTVTSLWVTLLLTVFYRDQPISMVYLWHVAGIAVISAVLFGVMYDALWNHFTLKPFWNILISSMITIAGGMLIVWLFSQEMFHVILPWWPGMLLLSVVLHTIAFYFYAKIDSRKRVEELNKILK
jgi:FlaA1/EpsC-like NDP-sugar epimerase